MKYGFALFLSSALLFAAPSPDPPSPQAAWEASLAARRLTWEPNRGQGAPDAQFLALSPNYAARAAGRRVDLVGATGITSPFRLAGDGPSAWAAEQRESGVTNYFHGNDPSRWVTQVPQFAQVRLANAYPGIDWVLAQDGRQVAYRFEVAPKADPALIRLESPGVQPTIDAEGNLRLEAESGYWLHRAPRAWQGDGPSRRDIPVSFVLTDSGLILFRLGGYDSRLPLVIDPVISFHAYHGGTGKESATGIAVTKDGFIHYTGWTDSQNFFIAGSPFQDVNMGRFDLFVAKLYPDGRLLYMSYAGGSQDDVPEGIVIDPFANAVVVGSTQSSNFPISTHGFQPGYGGSGDGFLIKMTREGATLLQSTYLGGSGADIARGVAVDPAGNVTVVGTSASPNFPTRNPWQTTFGGVEDAFLFKLAPNGIDVLQSTLFGGEAGDQARAVALDTQGNAIVVGYTNCSNLNPGVRLGPGGDVDVLLFKWRAAGNGAEYITCIGGSGIDTGYAVAVDESNNIYVGGATASLNFPTAQPMQPSYAGAVAGGIGDGFLLRLPAAGNSLLWSTYFGGNRDDFVSFLTLDGTGSLWATGLTYSANFPNTGAQTPVEATRTAFVNRLNTGGTQVQNAYFFGPQPEDVRFSVSFDTNFSAYLAGGLASNTGFPSAPAPLRAYFGGALDAWVAKLGTSRLQLVQDSYPPVVPSNAEFTFVQRVSNRGPEDAERMMLQGTLPLGLSLVGCTVATGGSCGNGPSGYRAEVPVLGTGRVAEVRVTVRVGLVPDGAALPVDATVLSDLPDDTSADNTIRTTFFTGPANTVCNFTSSPLTTTLPANGGATTFLVNAPSYCPWTVSTASSFISVLTPSTATGNGSAGFSLAPWTGNLPRLGTVVLAGQRYVLVQRAATDQPYFTDVPVNHPFFDTVQLVRAAGITAGCETGRYCPDATTSRGQMAVFIVRALLGSAAFSFSPAPYFSDVPATHPQFAFIQKLRELGVTNGCTAATFCPEDPVNRGQMAAFLIRARLGIGAGAPFPFTDTFGFQDVPPSHPFYAFIQKMRELGITSGCTATAYCPSDTTTRGQMSAFLARAFLAP